MITGVAFGSRLRGDANATSDRDLLLLGDGWGELATASAEYKAAGYSVSLFTYERARVLSAAGGLFFKHIYDEGRVTIGASDRFESLAASWAPARSYDEEIEATTDLFELLRLLPGASASRAGFVIDLVAVSVRSVLIRQFAADGTHLFSWRGLLDEAVRRGRLSAVDARVVLRARDYKNLYREGRTPAADPAFVAALLSAAGKVCGMPVRTGAASPAARRRALSRYASGSYKQLRLLELMQSEYPDDSAWDAVRAQVKAPAYFSEFSLRGLRV